MILFLRLLTIQHYHNNYSKNTLSFEISHIPHFAGSDRFDYITKEAYEIYYRGV